MRRATLALALLAGTTLPAIAADAKPRREPSAAQQAQQERMRQCSANARQQSLHGDPRKAFMKDCLSKRATG
ncbi:PsiF family protein [Paracraurococcus ruber]|uniref:PsiF repeat-containing protein n=1 Tax=Paracraurococcus ruber TaxID=77675 RepID=A0ABS1D179_9PROT|nr:PsiF family protein [Paracraurococcus ruber]MBK1660570.1 hypothetical protein [Paracraurococcus ruber]TDG29295.1 hypothetical protein E2C05_18350 [Paracraurococcus ruber]